MKQKLISLLTLLVLCVTGAWADDIKTFTFDDGVSLDTDWDVTKDIPSGGSAVCEITSSLSGAGFSPKSEGNKYLGLSYLNKGGVGITITTKTSFSNISEISIDAVAGDNGKPTFAAYIVTESGDVEVFAAVGSKDGFSTGGKNKWGNKTVELAEPKTGKIKIVTTASSSGKYAALDNIKITYADTPTITYSVTYNANGGTGDPYEDNSATTILDVDDCSFTAPSGKAFIGWNTENDGSGVDWVVGATVTNDLELYAQWENLYTVSFNLQSHGDAIDAQNIINGGKVIEPIAPIANGYVFGGWYKEAGCENAWNFTTDVVSENTTLYAKWTEYVAPTSGILFTLEFVNSSDVTMSDGETLSLTAANATITGGSASIKFFNSGKENQTVLETSGKKIFYNTNNMYLKLELNAPLQVGDVITLEGGTGNQISIANYDAAPASADAEKKVVTTEYKYTVIAEDALVGKSVLYLGRSESGSTRNGAITIMRPATVTVGTKGYATYVNSETALDFTGKSIKAYTIGSADGTALTLTQKDKVAKDEPVLLYSNTESDSQTIPAIADGEATVDATNKLVAGDGNTHTYEVGVTEHYILYTVGEKPGFYQANNSLVAKGKAYLDLTGVGGGARIMNFDLFMEDGVATGIAEMKSVNAENNGFFNLRGQRVAQPQKGLYIMNGKKVVVK